MMKDIFEIIQSVQMSKKVAPFLNGVEVKIEGVGRMFIKAEAPTKIIRSQGLRFVPFSFATKVTASNGIEGYGFGEGTNELTTLQKSIVEGVERVVFHAVKSQNPFILSSNGWAAHGSKEKANRNAMMELLERDAVLIHWLTETELTEIDPFTFPKEILEWVKSDLSLAPRFNRLRILVSRLGHIPSVTTILSDSNGFAVLSYATGSSLQEAIPKALAETCRIAEFASAVPKNIDFLTPEDHALAYANTRPLPTFVYGQVSNFSDEANVWTHRMNDFNVKSLVTAQPRSII